MSLLFCFTMMTILCLFGAFIQNSREGTIPHWYLIAHLFEICLYATYVGLKKYLFFSKEGSIMILFLLHDIFLVALMLLIASLDYLYISLTLFYYVFFFGVIVVKRRRSRKREVEEIQRCELPRKTFIEMTEFTTVN